MRKNIMFAMASLAFLPAVGHAAAPTLGEVLDASGITATGHASASYAYQNLKPSGGTSSATNTYGFDQAELLVSKLPAEGFGALVDVFAGKDVVGGNYNYGGGFNTFGGGGEFNLHQAFVQYATGGLTVIGGKFATLAGSEVASDVLNSNATRSILFGQQPFTLTGVRAGYKFSDLVTVYGGLSNSAGGAVTDGNDQKTVELGVALAPVAGLTVNVTDYIGNEGGAGNKTNLLDLVVGYTLGNLSLGLNADYNTVKESGAGIDTKFSGAAIYANYTILPTFRAGIRGEFTQAKDDTASTKGKASEVTLTGDYIASKNFDLVGDLRFNKGIPAATTSAGDSDKGTAFVVKAIYKF
jgi:hypothetical protein